jgi:hypothetical protein
MTSKRQAAAGVGRTAMWDCDDGRCMMHDGRLLAASFFASIHTYNHDGSSGHGFFSKGLQ